MADERFSNFLKFLGAIVVVVFILQSGLWIFAVPVFFVLGVGGIAVRIAKYRERRRGTERTIAH